MNSPDIGHYGLRGRAGGRGNLRAGALGGVSGAAGLRATGRQIHAVLQSRPRGGSGSGAGHRQTRSNGDFDGAFAAAAVKIDVHLHHSIAIPHDDGTARDHRRMGWRQPDAVHRQPDVEPIARLDGQDAEHATREDPPGQPLRRRRVSAASCGRVPDATLAALGAPRDRPSRKSRPHPPADFSRHYAPLRHHPADSHRNRQRRSHPGDRPRCTVRQPRERAWGRRWPRTQTRSLYGGANRQTRHRLVPLDIPVASSMRAPGEAVGAAGPWNARWTNSPNS